MTESNRSKLRQWQKIALALLLLFLSLTLSELSLRERGYGPLGAVQQEYRSIEPGGRFIELNSSVGYSLIPGAFKITFMDGHAFNATHSADRLRITHPPNESAIEKDEIWILGDSFTYGWELNDDQTFPWLLQKTFSKFDVVNFGIPGSGTVQSYLQFQDAVKHRKKPLAVVIAYASFHDERNTLARNWRKYFPVPVNNGPNALYLPYARVDNQGHAVYDTMKLEYREFPFVRTLALANLVDNVYNIQVDARLQNSHRVSQAIIKDFFNLAKQNDIRCILAGIYPDELTRDMLHYGNGLGMETVDLSVPIDESTYFPDAHPRPNANFVFAEKLGIALAH